MIVMIVIVLSADWRARLRNVEEGQRERGGLADLLGVQDPERAVRHAVDRPVRVAVLVADRDREAAVIGAHQTDHLSCLAARERQRRALARVRRPVLALFTYISTRKETRHVN